MMNEHRENNQERHDRIYREMDPEQPTTPERPKRYYGYEAGYAGWLTDEEARHLGIDTPGHDSMG
jgi:hypothetical protein